MDTLEYISILLTPLNSKKFSYQSGLLSNNDKQTFDSNFDESLIECNEMRADRVLN